MGLRSDKFSSATDSRHRQGQNLAVAKFVDTLFQTRPCYIRQSRRFRPRPPPASRPSTRADWPSLPPDRPAPERRCCRHPRRMSAECNLRPKSCRCFYFVGNRQELRLEMLSKKVCQRDVNWGAHWTSDWARSSCWSDRRDSTHLIGGLLLLRAL